MARLRAAWSRLRSSFWFVPALVIAASVLAAAALVLMEGWRTEELAEIAPRLFGAGADGSRAMLSAIATSMVTVAGVVFSITMVVLSQASAQYSPRVLRTFMRDEPTQWVLGVFLGVFAYSLVVLRTIRGEDNGDFVPSVAVLGAMVYAVVGVGFLVYFIHHVAQSIQASTILQRIAEDTRGAIDRLFPQELAEPAGERPPDLAWDLPARWRAVEATESGYLTRVDGPALVSLACECDRVIRLEHRVGDFVAEGGPLLSLAGDEPVSEHRRKQLRECVVVERQRTVEQDAAFGLQQLADVSLKALSPGINDPATAAMCVDRMSALLARLAGRRIPSPYRQQDGRLRVIAPAPDFAELVALALEPVARYARGDLQVLHHLMDAVERLAAAAPRQRHGALRPLLRQVHAQLRVAGPRDAAVAARRRLRQLKEQLADPEGLSECVEPPRAARAW